VRKYLAFDIGGTSIKYGVVNAGGRVLEKAETPSDIRLGGNVLMDKLLELTKITSRQHQLSGVGICAPGVVDVVQSKVVAGANHIRNWYNINQCEVIKKEFSIDCVIENDAKSAAIGENWVGSGKPYSCFYMATFGTGLGGALVINNKIHRGHSYAAGEICCLHSACLDDRRAATTSSLVAIARERFNDHKLDGREIFSRIRDGDQKYSLLLDEWCDFAALPLCDIYVTIDPEAIVIGGGISDAADIFLPRLENCIGKRLHRELKNLRINLVPAKLGNDAGMIGSVFSLCKKNKIFQ
jgi:predicted NBD/HSP70 family sugar kinase